MRLVATYDVGPEVYELLAQRHRNLDGDVILTREDHDFVLGAKDAVLTLAIADVNKAKVLVDQLSVVLNILDATGRIEIPAE